MECRWLFSNHYPYPLLPEYIDRIRLFLETSGTYHPGTMLCLSIGRHANSFKEDVGCVYLSGKWNAFFFSNLCFKRCVRNMAFFTSSVCKNCLASTSKSALFRWGSQSQYLSLQFGKKYNCPKNVEGEATHSSYFPHTRRRIIVENEKVEKEC